jgi:hypothetical protein
MHLKPRPVVQTRPLLVTWASQAWALWVTIGVPRCFADYLLLDKGLGWSRQESFLPVWPGLPRTPGMGFVGKLSSTRRNSILTVTFTHPALPTPPGPHGKGFPWVRSTSSASSLHHHVLKGLGAPGPAPHRSYSSESPLLKSGISLPLGRCWPVV